MIIQILGWVVIGIALIVGIVFMASGNSNTFDTGTDTTGAAVAAGVGIILGGIFYGAMFIGFGRVVVYVRKTAYILASTAIVGESTGGFAQAMQVAAPAPVASGGGWTLGSNTSPTAATPVVQDPTPTPQPDSTPATPTFGGTQTPAAPGPRSFSPPADPEWLPDPTARHEYRYWDGSKYTDRVGDQGVESSDPI